MGPKRTRLTPVYLTATERDLLVSGMTVLRSALDPLNGTAESTVAFAKSFTCRRIDEVVELLRAVDKKPVSKQPQS